MSPRLSRPITREVEPERPLIAGILLNTLLGRFILWLIMLVLFPMSGSSLVQSFLVDVLQKESRYEIRTQWGFSDHEPAWRAMLSQHAALPPEGPQRAQVLVQAPFVERVWVERVLARLEKAERQERDPWLADDYRQSWISILTFTRGDYPTFSAAFEAASYRMYGLHPDQLWPAICARREVNLGSPFERSRVLPKPVQSVPEQESAAKRAG